MCRFAFTTCLHQMFQTENFPTSLCKVVPAQSDWVESIDEPCHRFQHVDHFSVSHLILAL